MRQRRPQRRRSGLPSARGSGRSGRPYRISRQAEERRSARDVRIQIASAPMAGLSSLRMGDRSASATPTILAEGARRTAPIIVHMFASSVAKLTGASTAATSLRAGLRLD